MATSGVGTGERCELPQQVLADQGRQRMFPSTLQKMAVPEKCCYAPRICDVRFHRK